MATCFQRVALVRGWPNYSPRSKRPRGTPTGCRGACVGPLDRLGRGGAPRAGNGPAYGTFSVGSWRRNLGGQV